MYGSSTRAVSSNRSGVYTASKRLAPDSLNPPANALVIAIDEKPSIQALERAQGYLGLPGSKAVNGFSHCYERHGTTTLFGALEIAAGQVKMAHYSQRRRREFLDFMNEIVAANPNREIHVVLDGLNTHKPKEDRC